MLDGQNTARKKGLLLLALGVALVVIDQVIKILVKTNMYEGQTIDVFGDWCKLHYVLNKGMAFGMAFGGVAGKVILSLFRIVLFCVLCRWIWKLVKRSMEPVEEGRQKVTTGVLVGLTLITAGAFGNIVDCFFYGLIWPDAVMEGAPFAFLFGKVVDMFYFPLFDIPLPGGGTYTFFDAIFNFADSCVTVGAIYLVLFQWRFFMKD